MSAQPVDIQIFGRSLRVNCPPEQRDALNQAADELNQRLQDLKVRTRVTNTEQLVFIAALNICYELAQEKVKTRDYAANMEQRIRMLQQTIEQALLEQGRISERFRVYYGRVTVKQKISLRCSQAGQSPEPIFQKNRM